MPMSDQRFDHKALKTHFGRAAAGYDTKASLQQMALCDSISYAHGYWEAGAFIADIGCGTGMLAEEVTQQNFGWQIAACDIAYGMCVQAKARYEKVVNADAHALPFADGAFDGVFSSLMLQWASDPRIVLSEMARVIKKGGHCVISTFTHGTLKELEQAFAAIDHYSHVSRFLSAGEWEARAVEAGFSAAMAREKSLLEYYPDTLSLMRSIKAIGASHKGQDRRRGLMTKRQMAALEQRYREQFGTPQGLPLSWQLLYM